jgi:hypothetical protein
MMFIGIDLSARAARSAAAAVAMRPDGRRLLPCPPNERRKGHKGENFESSGNANPAHDVAKRAETGWHPLGGALAG